MSILIGIFEFFKELMPFIEKYFPAKTSEQKVEDNQNAIDQAIAKEKQTGRPGL